MVLLLCCDALIHRETLVAANDFRLGCSSSFVV